MPKTDQQAREWTGRDLIDMGGDKIGTVDDLRYDEAMATPKWLLVKTGLFGTRKMFVPASQVRSSGDRLVVSFTKDRVKSAPRIEDEEVLSQAEERELCSYYGLDYAPRQAEYIGARTGG